MTGAEKKHSMLVVDDSSSTLEVMQRNLTMQGYEVYTAPGVVEAIEFLERTQVDLIITDYMMPKINGFELVRYARENLRDTEIIIITGYASIEGAVEAMKIGAGEYLPKPFTDEELFKAVRNALEKLKLRVNANARFFSDIKENYGIIGKSEPVLDLLNMIMKVSKSNTTVLVSGESGTGKELVARAIHYNSSTSNAPFVPVNCGGIPETLLESELFGYVKGAFTGATETRAGFFQTADGGTIFLDEISETSLAMQVKLLRTLQEKEVMMLGSNKTQKVNLRIIAATNKDLSLLVQKGIFREDLFFRLNIITIHTPPLRERGDDILLLIRYFTEKYSTELGKEIPVYKEQALKMMRNYHWPGNIRELQNVVQRLIVLNDGSPIVAPDLPSLMRYNVDKSGGLNRTLEEVEYDYINNVMASVDNNKSKAAKILGVSRKTLYRKLIAFEEKASEKEDS